MRKEGLEPPHLTVPEPKGITYVHEAASTWNHVHEDAAADGNAQVGPLKSEKVGQLWEGEKRALGALLSAALTAVEGGDVQQASALLKAAVRVVDE